MESRAAKRDGRDQEAGLGRPPRTRGRPDVECHWTATPAGSFEGHQLYTFREAGDDGGGVVLTLVPLAVCGLLGL